MSKDHKVICLQEGDEGYVDFDAQSWFDTLTDKERLNLLKVVEKYISERLNND